MDSPFLSNGSNRVGAGLKRLPTRYSESPPLLLQPTRAVTPPHQISFASDNRESDAPSKPGQGELGSRLLRTGRFRGRRRSRSDGKR